MTSRVAKAADFRLQARNGLGRTWTKAEVIGANGKRNQRQSERTVESKNGIYLILSSEYISFYRPNISYSIVAIYRILSANHVLYGQFGSGV
jgi:hypothetical protein